MKQFAKKLNKMKTSNDERLREVDKYLNETHLKVAENKVMSEALCNRLLNKNTKIILEKRLDEFRNANNNKKNGDEIYEDDEEEEIGTLIE